MKRTHLYLALALVAMLPAPSMKAQDIPMAVGPGSYVAVGVGASAFQAVYDPRVLGGYMAYVDAHVTWRYGFEGEYRALKYHTDEEITQRTLLAGVHVNVWKPRPMRPYVKFLVGQGHMEFPFNYATGNYFTMAPGAGVDFMIGDTIILRAVDVEYQDWTQFKVPGSPPVAYGSLHPYGISAGISIRLNAMKKIPWKARPDYRLR